MYNFADFVFLLQSHGIMLLGNRNVDPGVLYGIGSAVGISKKNTLPLDGNDVRISACVSS